MKTKEQNCTHKNKGYCTICNGYPEKEYCETCKDIEYLDNHFPKGNKQRGEAIVLLFLARIEGSRR